MKHRWRTYKNGKPDEWAWSNDFHNGVICEDCGRFVCVCCNPDYMELDDCHGSPNITNAERIRAMSDEELANFIFKWQVNLITEFLQYGFMNTLDAKDLREWVKEPGEPHPIFERSTDKESKEG